MSGLAEILEENSRLRDEMATLRTDLSKTRTDLSKTRTNLETRDAMLEEVMRKAEYLAHQPEPCHPHPGLPAYTPPPGPPTATAWLLIAARPQPGHTTPRPAY